MKRSEAYHILSELWDNATETQRAALSIAQNDIEFVDLMPKDVIAVVRCKDCKYHNAPACPMRLSFNWTDDNDYCSYGERRNGDG